MTNFFLRNTNTRILNENSYITTPMIVAQSRDRDFDVTLKREFQGIPNQIGQNLPNAPRIANELTGHEHVIINKQINALLLGR